MDNRLKAEILPATILLNNFVTNEQDSNYEIFLLEYLNKSSFFQCKSDYHKFVDQAVRVMLNAMQYLQNIRLTSNY